MTQEADLPLIWQFNSGQVTARPWIERLMAELEQLHFTSVVDQNAKTWHLPHSVTLDILDTTYMMKARYARR